MIARFFVVIAFATLTGCPLSRVAFASDVFVPASYYPAGATISYRPSLSNHQMDCLWGLFCEGHVVLFHSTIQDQLRRIGGWAQFAGLHRHNHLVMSFELFASQYQIGASPDGKPWSKRAFNDLDKVSAAHGYRPMSQLSAWPAASGKGGFMVRVLRDCTSVLVVMAGWKDNREVEGIVLIDHPSASSRRVALYDLGTQMVQALGSM